MFAVDDKKIKKEVAKWPQYFLQSYLYSENEEVPERAGKVLDITPWKRWHGAILLETEQIFFDMEEDFACKELQKELHRDFFYLNLNARQALLLFSDEYCDYALVAAQLYIILKRRYTVRFFLAVSHKFDGYKCLPEILKEMEQQMEERFYHPELHIFTSTDEEEHVDAEMQDSRLMQKISEDVSRKDAGLLWKHFGCLEEKYQSNTQFSGMYVKFVFSNVLQELGQEEGFAKTHHLEQEVDRLYGCGSVSGILEIARENIREYEAFLENSLKELRGEVNSIKEYIQHHFAEELNLETLADRVSLSPGYLSYIFIKETGMNLNRYIHIVRLEKAKELLASSGAQESEVCRKVGFRSVRYFDRSFEEYYGESFS